jgi:hypothetical protein
LCCEPTNNGGFCQCGGQCCENHCYRLESTSGAVSEFCCIAPQYVDCQITDEFGNKESGCCQCPTTGPCDPAVVCPACLSGPEAPGRIGAVRRPGR